MTPAGHSGGPGVQIAEVTRNADAHLVLENFSIERPAAGTARSGYLLEIAGWTAGRSSPVVAVDIRHELMPIATATTGLSRPDVVAAFPGISDDSGFTAVVAVPGLPAEFRLEVCAHTADGRLVGLGEIIGRHDPLPRPDPGELEPLLVTSLGRTGTSWLMHVLGRHPAIVQHDEWGYELDALGFFEKQFRSAVEHPHGAGNPATFSRPAGSWWHGGNPFTSSVITDWFAGPHVGREARRCRENILDFYRRLATAQEKSGARYFAEKFQPPNVGFAFELFGAPKEIILVRDFRDMVCSILHFNRKRGFAAFDAEHAATDFELPTVLRLGVTALLEAARRRSDALLVRYEDLVTDEATTIRRLLEHLDLSADADTIGALTAAAAVPSAGMAEHRTSADAKASVGRWRTELDPAVVAACEREFAEALREFGYDVGCAAAVEAPPAPAPCASGPAPLTPIRTGRGLEFETTSDGRVPRSLARTAIPVDATISPDDGMQTPDVAGYLGVGESALKAIRLALLAGRAPAPDRILDFACGHGRVLRWLHAAYPSAQLTAADLLPDGVDFCVRQFGARGVYSTVAPTADLFAERYDLIWVGSLLTHLDVPRWPVFLDLLHELLAPGGLLVLTTHGELVAERIRLGELYGYPEAAAKQLLTDYEERGFGYMAVPGGVDYGFSVSKPQWVTERLLRHDDLRLVAYTEALWANHQDVVAVVRRPVDPAAPNRPYT